MKERNLVSIIIPTFRRPENLVRAIDSVLKQSYTNIEVIVVDDNGVNSHWQLYTKDLLKDYINQGKIQYIAHDINRNGSAARNTGFKASHGIYVGFLDDDDVFLPTKIEKQVMSLESCANEYGATYCNTIVYGKKRTLTFRNSAEGNLSEGILTGDINFNTSAVLFRRAVLDELHGFDESFQRHQDWELYLRFFRIYKICLTDRDVLLEKYYTPNVIARAPLKAIEYKEKFLNTFQDDIKCMTNVNKVFKCQYEMLALTLFANHCKKEGGKYAKVALKYGSPSLMVVLKYIYYCLR